MDNSVSVDKSETVFPLETQPTLLVNDAPSLPTTEAIDSQKFILCAEDTNAADLPKAFNIVTSTDDGNVLLEAGGQGDSQQNVELIQIAQLPFGDVTGDGKLWQIIPSNVNITTDSVVILGDQHDAAATLSKLGSGGDAPSQYELINNAQMKTTSDVPQWAKIINGCEKVGHYYRGWVSTEHELDLVLTLHKQQTNSFWGTRQSPDGKRPSARMMWKSQYVPFDGIPFINCGSRATVMECQFGPRRRGTKNELRTTANGVTIDYKHSCPARIYVKKVRKFPEYAIPTKLRKREQKHMMDSSFNAIKKHGFNGCGEDRFYMQLPTVHAHEYHNNETQGLSRHVTRTYDVSGQGYGTRLAEPVAAKIREIVASGIEHVTTIRKMLRKYVEKDLFNSQQPPVRHDLSYFPTVSDLKNHIHTALADIDNGTLPLREASMDTLTLDQDHEWTSSWASHLVPQPETVTVTLSHTDESNGHMISRVETHMSDGSTQVSANLTAETAALLARLHPNMFPSIPANLTAGSIEGEKLTQLVQSALLQSGGDNHTPISGHPHPEQREMVDSHLQESEPAPPTEGVQLDLDLPDAAHEVAEVILENEVAS